MSDSHEDVYVAVANAFRAARRQLQDYAQIRRGEVNQLDPFTAMDLEVEVSLAAGIADAIAGDLALQVTATGGCQPTVSIPIAVRLNIDDVPQSSAVDTFDAAESAWLP